LDRSWWYTVLFITAVVFVTDHSLFMSRYSMNYSSIAAGEKVGAVAEGSLTRRIGYVVFGLYGIVCWLRVPRFRLSARGLVAIMLLAFLGWAILSLTWSLSPMLTLRRLSALGLMALGISGLLRQFSGTGLVKLIFFMTLFYLIIGVGAEVALGTFRPWSSGYRFGGTLFPNPQGFNCAALVFSALTISITSKRFRSVLLAIALGGFGFLLLTGSRGALGGGIAGLAALWMLRTRRGLAVMTASLLICGGLVTVLLVVNGLVQSPLKFLLTEREEGVGVLTGRSDLWAILMEYARERPILGYGYGAFFDPDRILAMADRVGAWAFGGPHSLYLGALVDVGAIGLICLLGVLFGAVWRSVRVYQRTFEPHFLFFTAFLVLQICNGITEAEMLNPDPSFIPGLAMAFLAFRSSSSEFG
jgi:O-antigen ligase